MRKSTKTEFEIAERSKEHKLRPEGWGRVGGGGVRMGRNEWTECIELSLPNRRWTLLLVYRSSTLMAIVSSVWPVIEVSTTTDDK